MRRHRPPRAVDLGLDDRVHIGREVDAEIAHHLELRVEQLIARGYSPDEARAIALRRFGPLLETRADLTATATSRARHMRLRDHLDVVSSDLSCSIRQLRRAPLFAAAVILTLGLGIGANAMMFATIDRLLLRPPAHIADPGRLMTVAVRDTRTGGAHLQRVQSFPLYQELSRAGMFSDMGIARGANVDFGEGAQVSSRPSYYVNAGYFRAVGARPAAGRFFNADEAADDGSAPVVVLGYDFWQRDLAGDPAVIGRTIRIAGGAHTVIGIAPEGFSGVDLAPVDVWLPLVDGLGSAAIEALPNQRQLYQYNLIARLVPAITAEQAAERATAAMIAGEQASGAQARRVESIGRVELTSVLPRDARGDDPDAKVAALLGAVSLFVLLLACANVMNLQLARSVRRRREIAVRVALGVSRSRLIRQLSLDCLLLAFAGGAAGVLFARFGGALLRTALLGGALGAAAPVDLRVIGFTVIVSCVVGLVTGVVPAAELVRSDLVASLKEGGRTGSSVAAGRFRSTLVGLQAALTAILLVGTGLFVMSLRRIERVPLGFDPTHVGYARLNFTGTGALAIAIAPAAEKSRRRELFRRLEAVARETPGVTDAAFGLTAPFEGQYSEGLRIPGRDSVPVTREGGPYFNAISADYFATVGARIVAGRSFTTSDGAGSPPVAIVNETAARLWWPDESPLGKCIRRDDEPCTEIVGVVANMHRRQMIEEEFVQLFVPTEQDTNNLPGVLLFRTTRSPDAVVAAMHQRLQVAMPGLPYVNVRPLDRLIAPRIRSWKLGATMFAVFGALALVLAMVGLYSVLAYDVAQRQHELGVRRALGAATGDLVGLFVRRGLLTVAAGLVAGLVVALLGRGALEPLLFRTSPHDPLVFGAVAVLLMVVAVCATMIPALRAASVDPSVALRPD